MKNRSEQTSVSAEQPSQLRLNVERQWPVGLPFMRDGSTLYTLTSKGEAYEFKIARQMAGFDHGLWEILTDIEEVGVTTEGQWILVRTTCEADETDEDALVWLFQSREALCQFLWDGVDYDPAALVILNYLGALRFDLTGRPNSQS